MNFSRRIFSFGFAVIAFAVIALAAATGTARAQSSGQGEKRAESSAKDNEARVNDMAAQWKAPQTGFDYVKRVEMIPMRDGVKLYTVIVVPNGAKNASMILTRTRRRGAGRCADQWVFSDAGQLVISVSGEERSAGRELMRKFPSGATAY
jgi:predicted acyl esterase